MLSEEALERLSERLVNRIEELNYFMIKKLGEQIVEIGELTPSQLQQVLQSVKYGNNINEIINKIAEITDKNVIDIYEIFEEVAKKNQNFSKQFYEYKKIEFIPYDKNKELQKQVQAIAKITADEYLNMSKTSAYAVINELGETELTPLSKVYQEITDRAILNISQGRESYNQVMHETIRKLTKKGLRTVDYASGYSRRLDSAVRMNVMQGVRQLNMELQIQFGEEFGYDGIEVSHHKNPAPDHEDTVDGKQFSKEEYEKINNSLERHVGELNCYHFIYPIILGVSKPSYSKKELEEDKKNNKKGFEFEGEHYTNYEGTQLQRKIETKIRQYKDRQIGARAINDKDEVYHCQEKINQLTQKYNDLSKTSGLPTKIDRLRVDGYRKVNINKTEINEVKNSNILGQSSSSNISNSKKTFVEKIEINQIDNKIQNYNDIIRNKEIEVAYIIQKDGNVFKFTGNEETVNIYDVDYNGATITHNHLKDKYDDIYKSFGEDDFTFLKKHPEINKLYETNVEYEYKVKVLKELDIDKTTARNKGLELMIQEVGTGDEQHYMFKWLRNEGYVEYERFNRRTKEKD